jgi:transposase-like protein
MVKRKMYSIDYKNKLGAEMVGGISMAEVSKRENVSSQTLKRWKDEYLNFSGEETISKKEVTDLRKKVGELSVLLADALLEIDILKKTEKFLVVKKRKELLSSAISPSSLELRKVSKR